MKILEELWYGNVAPGERSVDKGDRLWNLGRLIGPVKIYAQNCLQAPAE